jgi:hypothetical protein
VKAGMVFVTAIVCIDAFFASYYFGLHSRTVDVEDPSIKPIPKAAPVAKPTATKEETTKKETKPSSKKTKTKPKPSGSKKKRH